MIKTFDIIGLVLIGAAGLGIAIWWVIDLAAEAAWRRAEVAADRLGRHRKAAGLGRR